MSESTRIPQTITRLLGFPDGEGLRFWEILAFFGLLLGLGCIGMWGYLWCSLRIFQEMSGLSVRARALSDERSDPASPA